MPAADPIRNPDQLTLLAEFYREKGNMRNYLLIVMGVYTALRIGDLLRLQWNDVYDFHRREYRSHISLIEQKTAKRKTIAINNRLLKALESYRTVAKAEKGEFLFRSRLKTGRPISRVQAWRIIRTAADATGIDGQISCHSLRKTFGYHAWQAGTSYVLLMDIFNHTSYQVTRRYLGVSQDDLDKVYKSMSVL